jgi:hypothetical protein
MDVYQGDQTTLFTTAASIAKTCSSSFARTLGPRDGSTGTGHSPRLSGSRRSRGSPGWGVKDADRVGGQERRVDSRCQTSPTWRVPAESVDRLAAERGPSD